MKKCGQICWYERDLSTGFSTLKEYAIPTPLNKSVGNHTRKIIFDI